MADTTDLRLFQAVINALRKRARDESISSEDSLAFEEFQEKYTPRIRRICRWKKLNAVDTEDVVQEIWRKIIAALPRFEHDGQKGRFRSWLVVTILRYIVTFKRKNFRRQQRESARPSREIDQNASTDSSVVDRLNEREREGQVAATIERMERDRKTSVRRFGEMFRKVALEGKSYAELAREYAKSMGAIKKDITRASQVFLRLYEQMHGGANRED